MSPAETRITVLAEQPVGAFLENLLVEADGSVLYTSYMDRTLRRYRPGEGAEVVASLDAHPVSIARRGADLWVVAHGKSFAEGSAFLHSNRLLKLDGTGGVVETILAPDARFLNGTADLPGGDMLVADSVAGVIWRFALSTRVLSVWLQDPLLLPDPAQADGAPGANGIKLKEGFVLISNTSRGVLLRGEMTTDERVAALTVFSHTGPIDDFHVDAEGEIVAATHRSAVIRVSRSGVVSTILAEGADGSTATAPVPGKNAIYVLMTGAAPSKAPGPARLLEVSLLSHRGRV